MVQVLQSGGQRDTLAGSTPVQHVFTFWKGRVALYGTLKALGIGPGDSVIVPGYTCAAVPGAVKFVGASSVYADIDPESYSPSLGTYSDAFKTHAHARVKALILQHSYGIPADVPRIAAWAREQGMALIEDCAHASGTRYRQEDGCWQEVGNAGDAAFFSSQWSKPVSTGLGGWLVTSDRRLAERLARFHDEECSIPSFRELSLLAGQLTAREIFSSPRWYWSAAEAFRKLSDLGFFVGTNADGEFEGRMPERYAKKMSRLQEWLLRRRLANQALLVHRRNLKLAYDQALHSCGLPTLRVSENADPVLLRYPVRVKNKDEVLRQARRRRIELGDWFNHPLHPREADAEAFGYRRGLCPEGERAAREVVNLPLTESTTEKTAREAVDFLKQVAEI
ncbi:MAG: DegT/DnrJ/EryC1/StrS family aminotransferase [Candidatus Acidiferrales bacterium]